MVIKQNLKKIFLKKKQTFGTLRCKLKVTAETKVLRVTL